MSKDTSPAPKSPEAAPTTPKKNPDDWAVATGNVHELRERFRLGGGRPGKRREYSWRHAAAALLHGWAAHEHHAGAPLPLTREAYSAALQAASEPVSRLVEDGAPKRLLSDVGAEERKRLGAAGKLQIVTRYEPHPAALSPHCAHKEHR